MLCTRKIKGKCMFKDVIWNIILVYCQHNNNNNNNNNNNT